MGQAQPLLYREHRAVDDPSDIDINRCGEVITALRLTGVERVDQYRDGVATVSVFLGV